MRKIFAAVLLIVGLLFVVAGGVAWSVTSDELAAANVTVAEDAPDVFGIEVANDKVDGPISAWGQAVIIDHHALEATGGKTYAELDRDDPLRATAASAASLRTSLFTSVMAFGVSALVIVLGLLEIFGGLVLLSVDRSREPVVV